MEDRFVFLLVGLTSAAAYVIGTRRLSLSPRSLGAAAVRVLEGLGTIAVFFAANLLLGGVLILAARAARSGFVSFYIGDDVTMLGLAVLQGLVFQAWRESIGRTTSSA